MQQNTPQMPNTYYRVSVKTLVFDADSKLLISKNREGEWEIPGGGLDHGETVEACAARELAEELQAKVIGVGDVAFCYPGLAYNGNPKLCVAINMHIDENTPLVPTDDDLVEARFVTREELLNLPFQKGEASIKDYVDRIWTEK